MAAKVKSETTVLFKASHRYARISARKARLVMDLIRGQRAEKALVRLAYCDRRASPMIRKVLQSAIANAAQMSGVESENLIVEMAFADEGPTMKRWRPRSMGRAFPRLKRSCHLSVALAAVEAETPAVEPEIEETITEEAAAEDATVEESTVEDSAPEEDSSEEVASEETAEDESREEEDASESETEGASEEEAPVEEEAAEEDSEAGTDGDEPASEDDSAEEASEEDAEDGDGDK